LFSQNFETLPSSIEDENKIVQRIEAFFEALLKIKPPVLRKNGETSNTANPYVTQNQRTKHLMLSFLLFSNEEKNSAL
jgi:hypothetical protein